MKTVGVVCEYNPLHRGHEKLLRRIRETFGGDAAVLCVMSGDFCQRGEPAVFSKYVRARAAVACGADLVVELPVTKALSSAEGFAAGAVEVLDALGVCDALSFGCECGSAAEIMDAARAMTAAEYPALLRERLSLGESYGAAKQFALEQLTGHGGTITAPNDILACEYCAAILRRESCLAPFAVKREGDYNAESADPENPSATAVRRLIFAGGWENFVPKAAAEIFRDAPRHRMQYGERAVLARLRGMTDDEWEQTAHGTEGLWSKMMKAARREASVAEILAATKSRRYPMTRIARLLLSAYLGIRADDLARPVPYLRVLAFSERGRGALKAAKSTASIPIINAGEMPPDRDFFALERRAGDLYALFAEHAANTAAGAERTARVSFGEI